jgi:hypothetical protein
MESIRSVKTSPRLSKTASSPNNAACCDLSQNKRAELTPTHRKTLKATTTSKTKFTINRFMKAQRRTRNRLESCLRRKFRLQVTDQETLSLWLTTSPKCKRKWSESQRSRTNAAQWVRGMHKLCFQFPNSNAIQTDSSSRASQRILTGPKLLSVRLESIKWEALGSSNNPIQT